jgi:proteasome lid subunit RPN8/RPN11
MQLKGEIIRNEPAFRPRPQALTGYHRFAEGTGRFEAFVAEETLRTMVHEAAEAAPDETIGYLIGRPFRDSAGYYTIVNSVIVAQKAKRGRTRVETTLQDEKLAVQALEQTFPTSEKLGWWHSHPFDLHAYSAVDRENQTFYCSKLFQLGLLVCLVGEEGTVHAFCGPDSLLLEGDYKTPLRAKLGAAASAEATTSASKAPQVHVVVTPPPWRTMILALVFLVIFGLIWPQILLICTDRIGDALKKGNSKSIPAYRNSD